MKHTIAVIAVLTATLLPILSGCATSGGPLFEEMVSSEDEKEEEKDSESPKTKNEAAASEDREEEKGEDDRTGIYIDSDPEDAEVYVNGFYRGDTPIFLENVKSGEYSVELRKEGYAVVSQWIKYDGESHLELVYELPLLTGFLELSVSPNDAVGVVDGSQLDQAYTELPVGEYSLTVKRFGYSPYQTMVTIEEDGVTTLDVELEPAPFTITEADVTKKRFSPENPGTLGSTKITFSVTNYGTGSLTIYDEAGNEIRSHSFSLFETWEQSFRWDGKDEEGSAVPDGEYSVVIAAFPNEKTILKDADPNEIKAASEDTSTSGGGPNKVTKELAVIVDRSAIISFRTMWSGLSGMLYAPTAETLPSGTFQFSTLFLGHVEEIEKDVAAWFPTQINLRYGLIKNLELGVQATAIFQTDPTVPYILGISGKYRFLSTPGKNRINLAAAAKGTYASGTTLDPLTNFTGFSLGLPFQAIIGIFHVVAVPELIISSQEISYNVPSTETFAVWGYGRVGFLFDLKTITTGISGALRTKSFTRGFLVQYPLSAGWELHWVLPKTQMALTAEIAGEFVPVQGGGPLDPYEGFYLMAGIGIEFIN